MSKICIKSVINYAINNTIVEIYLFQDKYIY